MKRTCAIFLLVMSGCAGDGSVGALAPTPTPPEGETQVGTIVGNSKDPPKSVLSFQIQAPESSDAVVPTGWELDLGILSVRLGTCPVMPDGEKDCIQGRTLLVKDHATIYSGAQVEQKISADQIAIFESALAPVDDDFQANVLSLEIAYSQQRFPKASEVPKSLRNDARDLWGNAFRFCVSDPASFDEAAMKLRCGNAQAHLGDMLVDLDNDAVFNFVDLHGFLTGRLRETTTRPQDYDRFMRLALAVKNPDAETASRLHFRLVDAPTFSAGKDYAYTVSFDPTEWAVPLSHSHPAESYIDAIAAEDDLSPEVIEPLFKLETILRNMFTAIRGFPDSLVMVEELEK